MNTITLHYTTVALVLSPLLFLVKSGKMGEERKGPRMWHDRPRTGDCFSQRGATTSENERERGPKRQANKTQAATRDEPNGEGGGRATSGRVTCALSGSLWLSLALSLSLANSSLPPSVRALADKAKLGYTVHTSNINSSSKECEKQGLKRGLSAV